MTTAILTVFVMRHVLGSSAMASIMISFASGLIFGLGLIVSQMINPAKVLAFLDILSCDPSLAFVIAGAVASSAAGYIYARRRGRPVFAQRLEIPTRLAS